MAKRKKVKLEVRKELYHIKKIEGDNYDDCPFCFGQSICGYKIVEVDETGRYFRIEFRQKEEDNYGEKIDLDKIWWDATGFKIY